MTQYLIMCRSMTYAQKASKLLERYGYTAIVVKAPQELTKGGCGYAVTVRRNIEEAIDILKKYEIPTGKIFAKIGTAAYKEVNV